MALPIILKGRNITHSGNRFCGTVKLEVTRSPEADRADEPPVVREPDED
jgi:hypothetical protein